MQEVINVVNCLTATFNVLQAAGEKAAAEIVLKKLLENIEYL